jgi:hypothetical protein
VRVRAWVSFTSYSVTTPGYYIKKKRLKKHKHYGLSYNMINLSDGLQEVYINGASIRTRRRFGSNLPDNRSPSAC